MELIHLCHPKEVEEALSQEGFYGFKDQDHFLHFSTWNSWPLIEKKLKKEGLIQEKMAFLVISSQNPHLDIRFEEDKKGISYPHVYGAIARKDILRFAPLDFFSRTNVLMNTSMIDEPWCRKALSKVFHSGQVVCVLAFSFFDDTKNLNDWNKQYKKGQGIWYRANTDVFKVYGIPEKDVHWVNYFTDSNSEMLNAVVNSDVLMLPGGAPDLAMKRIKEKKLLQVLKRYQGIVLGYSAGAMMQLENYHITPDEDYPDFSWQKGLGYLKELDIEVHYQATPHQKRFIERARQEKGLLTLAIYEKGGFINRDGQTSYFGQVDFFDEEN